jgi:hypothetical protein
MAEGLVTQDFIDRGLSGSTLHIATALGPHQQYVASLIDDLTHRVTAQFAYIPPAELTTTLVNTARQEYSRILNVLARLVLDSGLQPTDRVLNEFERKLDIDLATLEAKIANRCAILGKERATRPPSERNESRANRFLTRVKNHPVLSWVIVIGVIVIALGNFQGSLAKLVGFGCHLIHTLAPSPIRVTFDPTGTNEIAVMGPSRAEMGEFHVNLNVENRGRKTLYNCHLQVLHSPLLNISRSSGASYHSSLRQGSPDTSLTEVAIGDICEPGGKADSNGYTLAIPLKISVSFPASTPPTENQTISGKSPRSFEIHYQVTADNLAEHSGLLILKLGTPEAFRGHIAPVYTVQNKQLVKRVPPTP